jgi:hypothetical protein
MTCLNNYALLINSDELKSSLYISHRMDCSIQCNLEQSNVDCKKGDSENKLFSGIPVITN